MVIKMRIDLNNQMSYPLTVTGMATRQVTFKEIGIGSNSQNQSPASSNSLCPPNTCSINGCEDNVRSLGLCDVHYMRQWREERKTKNNILCACGCGELVSPTIKSFKKNKDKYYKRHHNRINIPEEDIVKLYEEGKTGNDIAKIFGVSTGFIYIRMRALGLKNRPSLKGEKGSNWRGGKHKRYGYVFIYKPSHPNNKNSYVREHVLIVEKQIGRYLKKNERVHHINNDRSDNRLENLWLCDTSTHGNAHTSLFPLVKQLMDDGIITFNKESGKYERVRATPTKCPICKGDDET